MENKLYFITGNKNKFSEVKSILSETHEVEQLDLDLEEIQEFDAHKIIQAKLREAQKKHSGEFIIEDTSLYLDCLGGLPGPLIKWFMQTIGIEGIYNITEKYGNNKAQAKTIIGYSDSNGKIMFFEGVLEGQIVKPSGLSNFGWDPIFKPKNFDKTFQEMSREEKNKMSMRRMAVEKLKEYLGKNN